VHTAHLQHVLDVAVRVRPDTAQHVSLRQLLRINDSAFDKQLKPAPSRKAQTEGYKRQPAGDCGRGIFGNQPPRQPNKEGN